MRITCVRFTAALLLGLLAAASPATAQQAAATAPAAGTPPASPAAPVPNGAIDPNEYRIGPEDVLQIAVWKNDAISRTVPVRPDGKVTLPLLNDVVAAGYTPMQFREELVQKLAEFMPSPEVSVIVNDIRSFKVSVIGEVIRPGRYELRSATTALDVLAAAGGFSSFANRTKIVVLRPTSTTIGDNAAPMKRIPFNYNRVSGGEQENIYLLPGDIVLVP